ncbi:MAG: endolytic transglycosylase MltG [Actinomycetota bacterium]
MITFNKRQISILALALSFLLIAGLMVVREARKPSPIPDYVASEKSGQTSIVIPEGASGDQIAQILFKADVVRSARAFFAAATAEPRSQSIQPGSYRMDKRIPGREAVAQLLDKNRRLMVLLIREGERAYELYDELNALKFEKSTIEETFGKKVLVPGFGRVKLEGFLFPATYNLMPDDDLESIRERLIKKFSDVTRELDFVNRAQTLNLTPYEALIIASIVQGEGYDEQDFGKVARVIYNRIKNGMPLQMDSTVLYALKERRIAVSKRDIRITSSYNTYNRRGLPPTPIGNPGVEALEASLSPTPGDWLYFVTVAPTETRFTNSYSEFLSFKREFQRNLKAGLFEGRS